MTLPIITAQITALILILQLILMLTVGQHRIKTDVGVGTGDDKHLERKIRRHGNLAENAALFLLALALAETTGMPTAVVTGFGIAFLIARLSHAFAFTSLAGSHGPEERGNPIFVVTRIIGAMGTTLSGLGVAGYILYMLSFG